MKLSTGVRQTGSAMLMGILFVLFACMAPSAQEDSTTDATRQLNIGMVLHLEGWPLDQSEDVLERYQDIILGYADLFEEYGAKMTFETANTIDAILDYEAENFLLDLQDRGHAVGVHADIGGRPGWTQDEFESELVEMRDKQLELGLDVRHVSGICSYVDWVTGALNVGFEYTTSAVGYCYQSMDEEDRPEEFRECANASLCHQFVPNDLDGRLRPWRAVDGGNWIPHDPSGQLVIIPSSGTLICFEENRLNSDSNTGCDFNQRDLEMFSNELDLALSRARPDEVNTFYVVWSLGMQLNEVLLERWLQSIVPYVQSGQVAWHTVTEMYDLYVEFE